MVKTFWEQVVPLTNDRGLPITINVAKFLGATTT